MQVQQHLYAVERSNCCDYLRGSQRGANWVEAAVVSSGGLVLSVHMVTYLTRFAALFEAGEVDERKL